MGDLADWVYQPGDTSLPKVLLSEMPMFQTSLDARLDALHTFPGHRLTVGASMVFRLWYSTVCSRRFRRWRAFRVCDLISDVLEDPLSTRPSLLIRIHRYAVFEGFLEAASMTLAMSAFGRAYTRSWESQAVTEGQAGVLQLYEGHLKLSQPRPFGH